MMNLLLHPLYLSLLLLAVYVLTKKYYQNTTKNLPPTPYLSLPIIGHLYLFLSKPLARTMAQLSQKYGPILYLNLGSRPVLVVSSPSAIEECFQKNDTAFGDRPNSLAGQVFGYNNTALVVAKYGPHWHNLRKISVAEFFSPKRLKQFSTIRHDEVKSLIRRLYVQSSYGEGHEMRTVFWEVVYTFMMRMITGDENRVGDRDKRDRFRKVVEEIVKVAGMVNVGDLVPCLRRVGADSYVERRFREVHRKSDELLQEFIDERRSKMGECDVEDDEGSGKGMIEVLLSRQMREPAGFYTDHVIKGLISVLILGGLETTTSTLEWALALLLNNPTSLHKMQAEIAKCVGQDRLLDESDLSHLPFLHCIINETLRMYPPVPLLVPRESSSDCVVEGYHVPRGTMLLTNVWAMNNDPTLWNEARVFKPERFERAKGKQVGVKLVQPFGFGRRACPGQGFAMKMVGITLGSLVQCFEIERISQDLLDMDEGAKLTMSKVNPVKVKLRPRLDLFKLLSQV